MASSINHELEASLPELVSFSEWQNVNKKDESYAKCQICNNFSRNFYCIDCVKNGNFTLSKKKCFEKSYTSSQFLSRFADKKAKKYKYEQEMAELIKRFEKAVANNKEIEDVKLSIQCCKEKVEILQKNIQISKSEINKDIKTVDSLKKKKSASVHLQQSLSQNLKKMREINESEVSKLESKKSELNSEQSALQSVTNLRVKELVTHIFPITKVPHEHEQGKHGQYAELEEAQKTTYVQGQWVIAASPMDNMDYKVVIPRIPSTGDYSAYPAWCSYLANFTTGEFDEHLFDVACGISGALLYSAQIVNILSFYMDVHLPRRLSINDFMKDESIPKFYHNVAKLNANIINLCLSQNVDISELSAHRTVSNLLLVIDSKNNKSKRQLSLEEQGEILESLEDSIFKDLPIFDESDNENSEADFVHVSDEDLFEVPEFQPTPKPPESSSMYSSVLLSLWRAAVGPK